jgi:hypothetical protein
MGPWGAGPHGPRTPALAHLGSLGSLLSVQFRLQSSCESQTGLRVHGAETLPFPQIGLVNAFCGSSIPIFLTNFLLCFCAQVLPTHTRTDT